MVSHFISQRCALSRTSSDGSITGGDSEPPWCKSYPPPVLQMCLSIGKLEEAAPVSPRTAGPGRGAVSRRDVDARPMVRPSGVADSPNDTLRDEVLTLEWLRPRAEKRKVTTKDWRRHVTRRDRIRAFGYLTPNVCGATYQRSAWRLPRTLAANPQPLSPEGPVPLFGHKWVVATSRVERKFAEFYCLIHYV